MRLSPSFLAGIGVAVIFGCGADAIASAALHEWFEASLCIALALLVLGIWRCCLRDRAAQVEHETVQRWHAAGLRPDELKRQLAEAVRLHRPTKPILAELQTLTSRMMAGAI